MKFIYFIILEIVISKKKETIIIGNLFEHGIYNLLIFYFYFLEDDYDYNLAPQVFDPFDGIQRSLDSDGKILMSDEGGAAGRVD